MLVLTRKKDQSVMIGDHIIVKVLDTQKGNVRLGIQVPKNITVYREEIYLEIQDEKYHQEQENKDAHSDISSEGEDND